MKAEIDIHASTAAYEFAKQAIVSNPRMQRTTEQQKS